MSVKRAPPPPEEEDLSSFWLITYSDMTTLLVALFLVIYSFTLMGEAQQATLLHSLNVLSKGGKVEKIERAQVEEAAAAISEILDGAIDAGSGTWIHSTENEVTVVLPSDATFSSGSAELNPLIEAQLVKISEVLRQNIEMLPNAIRVEGHTDAVPIATYRFPSNWHLSAARAQSVVRVLMAEGLDPAHLQVTGFADTRPAADNATPEGRAQNRRVEIKIMRGAPMKKDIPAKEPHPSKE